MSDEELFERYRAGDADAFRELHARYAPRLGALLRRSLYRQEEAADLVQQTFLQLHRARHDFRPGAAVRPWLYTIALNLARKHFRTLKRRPTKPLEGEVPDEAPPPGRPAERAEDVARLREALLELPENQREVIELHWFEGLPFAEVAQVVGASLSAVKVRAHRGYKRLRALLEGAGPGNPGPGPE
ncbi:MAG: RNA polymerase sigma factor [Planctomycetota bacterium]